MCVADGLGDQRREVWRGRKSRHFRVGNPPTTVELLGLVDYVGGQWPANINHVNVLVKTHRRVVDILNQDGEGRRHDSHRRVAETRLSHDLDVDSDLFAHLSERCLSGVFVWINVAAWVEPLPDLAVLYEQHSSSVVNDDCRGGEVTDHIG